MGTRRIQRLEKLANGRQEQPKTDGGDMIDVSDLVSSGFQISPESWAALPLETQATILDRVCSTESHKRRRIGLSAERELRQYGEEVKPYNEKFDT